MGTSCTGRGFISIKERNFYSENNRSLDQTPQGHGGVPFAGAFQHVGGQGARKSHLGSPSHKALDQTIFQGPFPRGLSIIL